MFTIITPTYKRSDLLKRTIDSVRAQTVQAYTHIIVNDSPDDASYTNIKELSKEESRVVYIVNEKNMGVNFSRNRALHLAPENSWVIFLDDDDYLAPDALSFFKNLIEKHSHTHWFMANRALKNGVSLTYAPSSNTSYNYALDYLITKKIKGDATHCIQKKIIPTATFSTRIKQGEEWLFFYQVGLQTKLFYVDHNSTLSDGYDVHNGLNFRLRPKKERLLSLIALYKEGFSKGLWLHITFLLYMKLRLLKLLIAP